MTKQKTTKTKHNSAAPSPPTKPKSPPLSSRFAVGSGLYSGSFKRAP